MADKGSISVQGVSKSFGGTAALREVSLEVQAGEFLTLLGPSGCGKTTLLRLIAGFEQPDRGAIRISGRDVAGLPPYKRPVNTVFQHYALFPHRDVLGNVAFGLETLGLAQAEVKARALRALELVRLPGFEHRRIDQLSGGQQQRVALARAVVLEPEVLLLDEPMSALDLKLRKQMQVEVKHLQARLKTTFVFVTHDQDEALVMSDRIAVMSSGVIEQLDAPERLYEQPRTRFVADFLAVRNLLAATVVSPPQDGHVRLRTRGGLELLAADDGGYAAHADVCIGVRPERIRLDAPGDTSGLQGTLDDELYLGDRTEWRVRAGDELLTVAEDAASAHGRARGDRVRVSIPPAAVLRLEDTDSARKAEGTRP